MKKEIENIKEIQEELFNEAENYRKNGKIIEALSSYVEFLNTGNKIEDYYKFDEVYWGMYLTCYPISKKCNNPTYLIEDFYNCALKYAPSEKKEEYKKIYEENLKSFNQEISIDDKRD